MSYALRGFSMGCLLVAAVCSSIETDAGQVWALMALASAVLSHVCKDK